MRSIIAREQTWLMHRWIIVAIKGQPNNHGIYQEKAAVGPEEDQIRHLQFYDKPNVWKLKAGR